MILRDYIIFSEAIKLNIYTVVCDIIHMIVYVNSIALLEKHHIHHLGSRFTEY